VRRKSKASPATKAASRGATRARRTMFGLACLGVLGLVAFIGSSAHPVGAAEAFPGQGFLPDNRAWEMVSPPNKNGGDVKPESSRTRAAADGNAIQFFSASGFGDSQSTGLYGEYIAERTAAPGTNGWATHSILPKHPPVSPFQAGTLISPRYIGEMSSDLSRGVYLSPTQLFGHEVPTAANNLNLYLRDDLREAGPGNYRLLTEPFAPVPVTPFQKKPYVAGASASFSNVIFESEDVLTDDAMGSGEPKLYESEEGDLRLAGRIPASGTECDEESGPACVAAESSQAGQSSFNRQYTPHMVSADGRRVFFRANETGNVYMREDGHRTVQLNVSEKAIPESSQGASLYDASASGDRVFFSSGEGLVEGDDNNTPDLYMAEPGAPAGQRLTLVSVDVGATDVIGASDDGHYIYFVNGTDIDVWHDGDSSYIGRFALAFDPIDNGLGSTSWFTSASMSKVRVAPDGRHLLFVTRDSSGFQGHGGFTGYDQGECAENGGAGCTEQFLYNAETEQLRCATCNFGTLPTANAEINTNAPDVGGISGETTSHLSHALSDDGRFVFFNTPEALVPEDINGRIDAYEYDASTEEIHLLSSGRSGSNSYFVEAGASGHDVFIATREPLSAWDTDTSFDLYDARIDGGLPEPLPPPPSCQGDACQPAPLGLSDPTPASSSYSGPKSSSAKHKARCAKGRHVVKSKGKSRCVKSKHKRAAKQKRRAGK
jgi:hypothetical protein